MSYEISQREYWEQVREIARDVTQESRDEKRDIHEALHEAIDSHQWIIYTGYAEQVMHHTGSADAIEELGGVSFSHPDQGVKSWAEIVAQFAFCALMQDVVEHAEFDTDKADES